jgi:2,3-bisphosphoglycerate-independent phosphoglycerate mutase
MEIKKTKVLCILDGLGLAGFSNNNAVALANTPNIRKYLGEYNWTSLNADGEFVGQEKGLVGNSEVGHMNLGGLQLVPQLSYQVTHSSEKEFSMDGMYTPNQNFDPKALITNKVSQQKSTIHLIGLFSTGTIHSDLRHWIGAIKASINSGATKVVLHLITDGRDSDRQSFLQTWKELYAELTQIEKDLEGKLFLGSVGGRFYAMDRDNNQDRVEAGLEVMTSVKISTQSKVEADFYKMQFHNHDEYEDFQNFLKEYNKNSNILKVVRKISQLNYEREIYDEYINPIQIPGQGIKQGDLVWLLNFRTDRFKQLSSMLCTINKELSLDLCIMGNNDYGDTANTSSKWDEGDKDENINYYSIFKNEPVKNTISDYISSKGYTQLHIAETEKYNHVTYFFNGGINKKNPGEEWQIIPSNKVQSHAQQPEMKAKEITDFIIENAIGKFDYVIVNYANPDMLGHTGDLKAAIKSMEFMDFQLGRLVESVLENNGDIIITADHGNIEMIGEISINGHLSIDTEHNSNPVPLIWISKSYQNSVALKSRLDLFAKSNLPDEKLNLNIIDSLYKKKSLNITYPKWLENKEIPSPVYPIWYAGLLLILL